MLAYLAILITGLVLCCGIAVDVGLMQMHKLQMQSAADAAALGAVREIELGNNSWASSAQSDAGLNGFSTTGGATLNVAMRPSTGNFAGFYDAVEATISQPQSTLFMKLLGTRTATIKARSVAVVTPCVYLTGANALTTYQISTTSATLNSANCPFYINSKASVDANSGVSIMAENITGASANSSWLSYSAPPRYAAAVVTDPLASISQSGISATCSSNTNTGYSVSSNVTASASLSCGNTSITCNNTGTTVTFSPGLYKFGGSFTINTCTIVGTGVTMYFTKDANNAYGTFKINNSVVNLSAPTTTSANGFAGILVMTDRNFQHVNAQDFQMNSSTVNADGIWYLTGAGMAVNSGVFNAINYMGVVADNLVVYASTFSSDTDYSTVTGGNPFRPVGGLVE